MKYIAKYLQYLVASIIILLFTNCQNGPKDDGVEMGLSELSKGNAINELVTKFGEEYRQRIETGINQVSARWTNKDGSDKEFLDFCLKNFIADEQQLDILFQRYEKNLESLYGNLHKIDRQFSWALQIESGPIQPVDYLFGNYNPYAHVDEDLFNTKIAFAALLNFPITSLEEKTSSSKEWSRKDWAYTRLAEEFSTRIPAEVSQVVSENYTSAEDYIAHYNIYMYNLLYENGKRLYDNKDLYLVTHWGLRDELKAQYAETNGFEKQKLIYEVMKRILRQEIPQLVIDNNQYDWNPYTNEVFLNGEQTTSPPEDNLRYRHILNNFKAELLVDKYSPDEPTKIDRLFNREREIPEKDFEAELVSILTAPVLKQIAGLIKERLGRELQPFDIWYNGFKPRSSYTEEDLDKIVKNKYPNTQAFQNDMPGILRKLGFTNEKAQYLFDHIQIDPSRGVGHAMGARMKDDKAHLRTRIPESGMLYKGYNIAVHEFGHNVEQVFSLNGVDYYSMEGVPNTAFTEAFAFVFQSRDLELLGIKSDVPLKEAYDALENMWAAFEISGVALVDMHMWRWMYEHPNATADQLREAVLNIAKDVWNKYYEPVLGHKDTDLLAIYSHMVYRAMYIPDYPMGHIISFQIEQYLKDKPLATEMERMCKLGRLTPQEWMKEAVGENISAQPLITAAGNAVKELSKK